MTKLKGKQILDQSITQDKLNLTYPENSYDAATKEYVDYAILSGSSSIFLSGLTDVNISAPTNNDLLTYNNSLQKWNNYRFSAFTEDTYSYKQDGEPSGFIDRTSSIISFNTSSREFKIEPTLTSFEYFNNSKKYTSSAVTYIIPNTLGDNFIYYDENNTFTHSTTPWNFKGTTQIAYIFWNPSGNTTGSISSPTFSGDGFMLEERHGHTMDWATHQRLHNEPGTVVTSGGFLLGGYSVQPAVPTSGTNTFSISSGNISDEDIISTLPEFIDPSDLGSTSTYTIFYRYGTNPSDWRWYKNYKLPYVTGNTYLVYNQNNGGNFQLTELINGQYVNYYMFGVPANNTGFSYILVPGQNVYAALADAQAESVISLNLGTLPFTEIVSLYQITWRANNSYNTVNGRCRIEATPVRIVGQRVTISGLISPTNHSSLSNRTDIGSHPATAISTDLTYFNSILSNNDINVQLALESLNNSAVTINTTQTISGQKTFTSPVYMLNGLYVSGTTTFVNTENLNIKDNFILINSGETGAGVTKGIAGIEVDRGTEPKYGFYFEESTDTFRVGLTGDTQAVATRENIPVSGNIATWDGSTYKFVTTLSQSSFLSANTSYYTQAQANASFLSANTSYYTQSQINTSFVNTGLTQTISGVKTFTGGLTGNTIFISASNPKLQFYNGGLSAPSNINTEANGDRAILWNNSVYKGAWGFNSYEQWFQGTASSAPTTLAFRFYGGTSSSPVDLLAFGQGSVVNGFVWNETGLNLNARFETTGSQYMLFVQGSTNRVGINNSSPEYTLDVSGDTNIQGQLLINGQNVYYTKTEVNSNFLSATTNFALSGLSDVQISSPSTNQILVYSATTQKWMNVNSIDASSIYYTKSEIDLLVAGFANSATTVTTNTSQEITGFKYFINGLYVTGLTIDGVLFNKNNFLSANTYIPVSTDFLSANTSYYTQEQANNNFLSANTTLSAGSLSGLTDVNINNPSDNQVLVYSATTQKWINEDTVNLMDYLKLSGLTDVLINNPSSGQVLTYNGSVWVNSGSSGGDLSNYYTKTETNNNFLSANTSIDSITSLTGLTDVLLTNPQAFDLLTYNGSEWINLSLNGNNGVQLNDNIFSLGGDINTSIILRMTGTTVSFDLGYDYGKIFIDNNGYRYDYNLIPLGTQTRVYHYMNEEYNRLAHYKNSIQQYYTLSISGHSWYSDGVEMNFTPDSGLTYKSDYKLKYTNRSLVDKEYVDLKTSGSTSLPQVLQNILSASTAFDNGTTTIDSTNTAYKLVKYDYVIYSGTTNMRGGNITIINNGTSTKANEVTTEDIGDTSTVTFTTDINGGNTRLRSISTTDGWIIKYIKYIV